MPSYTKQLNLALDNLDTVLTFVSQDIGFDDLNNKLLNCQEAKNLLNSIKELQIKIQESNIDKLLSKSLTHDEARVEIYERLKSNFKDNLQALKAIRSAWVKNLSANDMIMRAERFDSDDIIKECKTILANIRKDVVVVEPESDKAPEAWYKKLFKL